VTVAPEREQSANSHAITLDRPLRHRQVSEGVHAVDGTPADCVYVALYHRLILRRWPDLVVSGINHGPNLGTDVFYSGTVAAAREGALRRIPAMAVSLWRGGDFTEAAVVTARLVERLLRAPRRAGPAPLLNVNFPKAAPKGIRVTRLGRRLYSEEVSIRTDPRGREYYWIGGPGGVRHEPMAGSDTEAVDEGFVSVTPLELEATSAEHLDVARAVAGSEEGA
jgi:5'-nucleotidase